ncbi:MAG: periplasmic heavy metal sensor [candidate division WOR-3 bacterium]
MNAIKITLALIISLGFFGITIICAQSVPEPMPCPHHQKMVEKKEAVKLEFTLEQERELHKLKLNFHKESAPLRTEIETKEMELRELWLEEKPDVEKIIKKAQEIHKLQGQLQEKEIRHRFAILKILTPEQRKVFQFRQRCQCGPMERCRAPRDIMD